MRRREVIGIAAGAVALCAAILWWPEAGLLAQDPSQEYDAPLVYRDLDSIRQDTLRVLVIDHPLSYEEWPRAETGLEYELLERFAKAQGMPLRALRVQDRDSLLMLLQQGAGDVVAAQIGPAPRWGRRVAYSAPYKFVFPVRVQLRAQVGARVPSDAARVGPASDTALISPWSPFLDQRREELVWVRRAGEHRPAPNLPLRMMQTREDVLQPLVEVIIGAQGAALVTSAEAAWAADRFPQLTFEPVDAPHVALSFAVRRNADQLRMALNDWLENADEQEARRLVMKVYGEKVPKRGPLGLARKATVEGDSISPFDDLFRAHADRMPYEWELLAAIAYKESRFDPHAVSSMGAQGLMQMMPRTAAQLGLPMDEVHALDDHIRAASSYLATLDTIWMRSIPDRNERLRFVLAAYNAGPGHVLDAQRLAERMGLDRRKWEGHVERAITLLAMPRFFRSRGVQTGYCKGSQTFNYVRDVLGLYQRYRALGIRPDTPVAELTQAEEEAP
ncbi:MAG: transglycosylase SLT domain-containing protein [Flavobacteriales bacterium]|nr:transglycosylase SLT domain-containing protein [Flavobacteriales bacterium]